MDFFALTAGRELKFEVGWGLVSEVLKPSITQLVSILVTVIIFSAKENVPMSKIEPHHTLSNFSLILVSTFIYTIHRHDSFTRPTCK
jgi:hypothetical protein